MKRALISASDRFERTGLLPGLLICWMMGTSLAQSLQLGANLIRDAFVWGMNDAIVFIGGATANSTPALARNNYDAKPTLVAGGYVGTTKFPLRVVLGHQQYLFGCLATF